MNKISFYILIIFVFLGLSENLSPSKNKIPSLISIGNFNYNFKGAPLSLILLDSFESGVLIKTYYHKYKVVYAFKDFEIIVVRVSQKFWKKNLKNHKMSLFRRKEEGEALETVPLPPGSLYIGDLRYGKWNVTNSGTKKWSFYNIYKHLPNVLLWQNFVPSFEFYEKMVIYKRNKKKFYGLNNEFGTNGSLLKKSKKIKKEKDDLLVVLGRVLKRYISFPPFRRKNE